MNQLLKFLFVFFLAFNAYSHGEDKSGPHQGFVRMPGAFHIEVVPISKNKIKIYLLDIDWKNPSVKRSSMEVTLKTGKDYRATCKVIKKYFECAFLESINLKDTGQLIVLATREGRKGSEALYSLPLKLEK